MRKSKNKNKYFQEGFTLMETLIYVAIFAISATFLVSILNVVGRVQNRQGSANEVNQQISFVNNTIQRLVKESSLVENPSGVASTSLVLRMLDSNLDPTKVFLENGLIYLAQGMGSPISLIDKNIAVQNFSVTKYENSGGPAVVQVDLTLSYNTGNPQALVTRTARTAFTRISAATFDSSILPNGSGFSIGQAGSPSWNNIFLSGGNAANPSYSFVGDANTGIFSPATDIIGITTGGIERMRIDETGKVRIMGRVEITDWVKISNLSTNRRVVCVRLDGYLGMCTNQPVSGACDCQ